MLRLKRKLALLSMVVLLVTGCSKQETAYVRCSSITFGDRTYEDIYKTEYLFKLACVSGSWEDYGLHNLQYNDPYCYILLTQEDYELYAKEGIKSFKHYSETFEVSTIKCWEVVTTEEVWYSKREKNVKLFSSTRKPLVSSIEEDEEIHSIRAHEIYWFTDGVISVGYYAPYPFVSSEETSYRYIGKQSVNYSLY